LPRGAIVRSFPPRRWVPFPLNILAGGGLYFVANLGAQARDVFNIVLRGCGGRVFKKADYIMADNDTIGEAAAVCATVVDNLRFKMEKNPQEPCP